MVRRGWRSRCVPDREVSDCRARRPLDAAVVGATDLGALQEQIGVVSMAGEERDTYAGVDGELDAMDGE